MNDPSLRQGTILFAHGARDPRWAEPFERLRSAVVAQRPDGVVVLAFLEMMSPDLDAAVDQCVAAGCDAVTIVPVFFGQGAHLRRDLPEIVARVRARVPGTPITVVDAVGEDAGVIAAIADYCVRSIVDSSTI